MTENEKIKIIHDTWESVDRSLWREDMEVFRAVPKKPPEPFFYNKTTETYDLTFDVVEFRKISFKNFANYDTVTYGVSGLYKDCHCIVWERTVYRKEF